MPAAAGVHNAHRGLSSVPLCGARILPQPPHRSRREWQIRHRGWPVNVDRFPGARCPHSVQVSIVGGRQDAHSGPCGVRLSTGRRCPQRMHRSAFAGSWLWHGPHSGRPCRSRLLTSRTLPRRAQGAARACRSHRAQIQDSSYHFTNATLRPQRGHPGWTTPATSASVSESTSRNTVLTGIPAAPPRSASGSAATAAMSARCRAKPGATRRAAIRTTAGSADGSMPCTAAVSAAQLGCSGKGRHRGHRQEPVSSRTVLRRTCPHPTHSRDGTRRPSQHHHAPRTDDNGRQHPRQAGAARAAAPVRRSSRSSSPSACGAGGRPSRNTSGRSANARTTRRCRTIVSTTAATAFSTVTASAFGSTARTCCTIDSRGAVPASAVLTSPAA
jgi:hypothetical protein